MCVHLIIFYLSSKLNHSAYRNNSLKINELLKQMMMKEFPDMREERGKVGGD